MPTGYTAGILDGEITEFEQFAKLCMRSFGATIHMRDDDLDKVWEPRKPSEYHQKKITEAKALLELANTLPDDEIIERRIAELVKDKDYHTRQLQKQKEDKEKLEAMLKRAKDYTPPTTEHVNIKSFMIEQLSSTIDLDCNDNYHSDALRKINKELKNIQPDEVRGQMVEKANKDIAYHEKGLKNDVARCNEANKWVETFLSSLSTKT